MRKILLTLFIFFLFGARSEAGIVDKIKGFFRPVAPNPAYQGYKGTLPDIERFFEYKNAETKSLPDSKIQTGPVYGDFLLDAPFDDDTYLDVIIKKEKASPYVNDIMKVLPILENLKASVEAGDGIQKFNANVNVLDLYTRSLEEKYGDKMEAHEPSYIALLEVNYRAKLLGNLKFDANFYSRYMPLTDEAYSPKGIAEQDEILASELARVINIIKLAN